MAFDTKSGDLSNVLTMIPGDVDVTKLAVFGFDVSRDGKYALMNVNAPADSKLGGQYMVDLAHKKAKKILPPSDTQRVIWCGRQLIVPNRDPGTTPPPKFDPNTGKTTYFAAGGCQGVPAAAVRRQWR